MFPFVDQTNDRMGFELGGHGADSHMIKRYHLANEVKNPPIPL